MEKRISGLAHCCHHNKHYEYCYDYEERVKDIKEHKPVDQQELRLHLFFIFPGDKVPEKNSLEWEAYLKAWETYDKARENYDKAWEAYLKAWENYNKAWEAYLKAWETYKKALETCDKALEAYLSKFSKEIRALHDELCPDCTWNGKTIRMGIV